MTTEQLAAELKPALRRYHPKSPAPLTPAQVERRHQIKVAMRRLRAQRRAAGLNAQGKPLKPVNMKFINKKWRKRYAK